MTKPPSVNARAIPEAAPPRWAIAAAAGLLALLVAAVFLPILGFEFVDFDVYQQVLGNPDIQHLTLENLEHILTSRCITSYYPVRTLSYAVDCQIWGLWAGGFKLTNALIHLANVLLVFWLVLRLLRHPAAPAAARGTWWDLAVATLSAGLFAVHPVVVEPVTWVAGREELLMTLGALGTMHFHLTARRLGASGGNTRQAIACHAGAALSCAVACLSNAVAAVIPALIVAWDVLMLPRPKLGKILAGTAALWAIAAATILIKRICESDGLLPLPAAPALLRVGLILKVYWLNLKTLLWPTQLALYYDWELPRSLQDRDVILGGIALVLTGAILWRLRRRKLALFGLLWLGLALGPTAQIMPHHVQRADRFLYLPLVGAAVALGAGLWPLVKVFQRRALIAVLAAGSLGLLLVGARSRGQVETWRTSLSTWEQCLRIDPENASAHEAFADGLVYLGRVDEAITHYERALEIAPNSLQAMNRLALTLARHPNPQRRDHPRAIALTTRACELTGWKNREVRFSLAMAHGYFARDLQEEGHFARAIRQYYLALDVEPDYDAALFDLALLLATCPEQRFQRREEALRLAEEAHRLVEFPNLKGLSILATVYAQAGRFSAAARTLDEAIEVAQAAGDAKAVAELRRQRQLYESRAPFHPPAPTDPQ